jgi:hypothetical protein
VAITVPALSVGSVPHPPFLLFLLLSCLKDRNALDIPQSKLKRLLQAKGKAKLSRDEAVCKAHNQRVKLCFTKSASNSYFASKSTSDPADKTNRFLSAVTRGLDNIIKYYFKPPVSDLRTLSYCDGRMTNLRIRFFIFYCWQGLVVPCFKTHASGSNWRQGQRMVSDSDWDACAMNAEIQLPTFALI